jgi:UDP-N-acetyl-D-glucosamine dehydrogenase
MSTEKMDNLIGKIHNGCALIGIIGLGYVGLPLGLAFARKFKVYGYDVNKATILNLINGKSHIQDISDNHLLNYVGRSLFPTTNLDDLKKCDFIIICVPTPLTEDRIPDLNYIKSACKTIARILRKNQFIILESTTYPGTTEDIAVPILEETGLRAGDDFGIAYSPERIDPGNKNFTLEKIPKVVGGFNDICGRIAAVLYASIIDEVVTVRNMKTAESVKMVENIFRNVNIALMNELALIFERMGIDIWEVIDAAATKPYGFMPFYPGPGIGGHCIPLDPFYMSYRAKRFGFIPRFIETSGEINEYMKMHMVNLTEIGLKHVEKRIYGAKVAVLGLAYKKNINDMRESPAIKIIEELVNLGAEVRVFDPFIPAITTKMGVFNSMKSISDVLDGVDCAIFLVDHDLFKGIQLDVLEKLMDTPVVIDGKNLFQNTEGLVYLGVGKKPKLM